LFGSALHSLDKTALLLLLLLLLLIARICLAEQ
jgi:hypothetical protein